MGEKTPGGGLGEAGVCVKVRQLAPCGRLCLQAESQGVLAVPETGLVPTCDSISAHQRFGRGGWVGLQKAGI